MSFKLIDGKQIAADIRAELRREVDALKLQGITPGLATLLVGDNAASEIYVRNKHKACQDAGMISFNHVMPKESTQSDVLKKVEEFNEDPKVHGILVQLPMPPQVDPDEVLKLMRPEKDADGFHPFNLGRLFAAKDFKEITGSKRPLPVPCTPLGVMEMLERCGVQLAGKNAVVVGRSMIVGKPMAALLLSKHATVTIVHSQTRNLPEICAQADVLVAAIGKPKFITANMVKSGAVVMDVGINRLPDGKICGDVDFEAVKEKTSWITPVPGGVGPMTIAMLLKNTLLLAKGAAHVPAGR